MNNIVDLVPILKETLEKYFIEVPEDYTMDTELTTKSEYGNYKIKVSEIYDRDIMIASEEESDDNTTITPSTPSQSQTSLSTGGNSSSSNNSNSGSTSNNGNTTNGTINNQTIPKADDTIANIALPKAGIKYIFSILVIIIAVSIFMYAKYRKLQDIK